MTTLADDKKRFFVASGRDAFIDIASVASDIIYEGAAVGEASSTTGTGQPLVGGTTFIGFCLRRCDNSSGAANAKKIRVQTAGIVRLPVTGVDNINDYDATVYAVDDDTFTLTSSTGHTAIGKVAGYEDVSGTCLVAFEGSSIRSI